MIYPLYSIRDNKVGFMIPVLAEMNDRAAVRNFSFSVNNSDTVMGFAPADYDLYKVGEFDTDTGKIKNFVPVLIASGSSVFGAK